MNKQEQHGALLVDLGGMRDVLRWCETLNSVIEINSSINSDEPDGFEALLRVRRAVALSDVWKEKLINELFECKDVFLSYCSQDVELAQAVTSTLEQHNLKVFFSREMISSGAIFDETIRLAMFRSEEVWLLITEASLKSEWVTTEWGAAWALGKTIVPIMADLGGDMLPLRLKVRQHVALQNVNHAVARLKERI